MIDLQCNDMLKESKLTFHVGCSALRFLFKLGFGTVILIQKTFSVMEHAKSAYRSVLTDQYL